MKQINIKNLTGNVARQPSLAFLRRTTAALLALAALAGAKALFAQGTAFSYQGRLDLDGTPVTGYYDVQFSIYNAAAGGAQVGGPSLQPLVISNGLVSVNLDFGSGVFTGDARWLDVSVRTNGAADFTGLGRQPVLAAPYAIFAGSASSVASGTAVQSLNGVKDNVTLAVSGSLSLATNGNTLTLTATGGAGVWSLNGSSAYYNGGNVGIGTNNPQENLTIAGVFKYNSGLRLLGGTSLGTGLALENTSAGGRKFDLLTVGSGGFPLGVPAGTFGIFDETFGAYRLAINSLGQVGIGTATPTCLLDVGWNGNDLFHLSAPMPFMTFRDTSAGNARGIIYSAGGALALYTENYWNGSNPVGFLKLATNGNVGVGTDLPHGRLEIAGSDDALRIDGSQPYLTLYDSVNYRSRIQGYGGDVMLETEGYISGSAPNNFAVLRGNGSFCIGTRVADATLNVANVSGYDNGLKLSGNSTSGTGLALENTSAGGHKYAIFSGGSGDGVGAGGFGIYDDSAGIYRVGITAGGLVGINTYAPVSTLDVRSGQDALSLWGYQPFMTFRDTGAGNAYSRIQAAGGALNFFTDSYMSGANANNYAQLANSGNFSVKNLTIRGGADVAEPFQVSSGRLAPGSVVVIDEQHPGKLKLSSRDYDTRVAGIVSGANGVNPGLSLHQEGVLDGGQEVALSGRVYVLADATTGAISPGDLLTTASSPGHAMKAADHGRAQGAILGKAMSGLAEGKGMVLVLVSLQ